MIRAKPYQFLYNNCITGVAWLPSVRAVKCLINFNKRAKLFCIWFNIYCWKYFGGRKKWRQVRMTLINWATFMCYSNINNLRSKNVSLSNSYKKCYMNYYLQFDNMKMKLLVIVNKNVTVNMFLGLVHTARHAMENFYVGKL